MPACLLFKATVQNRDVSLDPASVDFVYVAQTLSAPTALLAGDVSVAINHFFQTLNTGQSTILGGYWDKSVDNTRGIGWQAYDITAHLNGSPHGSPINSGTYSITTFGASTVPVPQGVAACISYRGNYGTDVEFVRSGSPPKVVARPRSRHRGRIYFGPLGGLALQQAPSTFRTSLTTAFMTDALAALQGASTITDSGSNKWHLSHWSKKNATTEDIVLSWIDDRPDYQRRRSDQSTVRSTATYVYS